MKLDDATVRHIAALARLALDDAEIPVIQAQLGAILDYVEQLAEIDTEGVEPTVAAGGAQRPRPVGLRIELEPGAAVAQAADAAGGAFRVPKVIQ